jgi:cyclase
MRLIAAVQIEHEKAVKTVRFKNPAYIGDPFNILRILDEKGAQEIAIMDIEASKSGKINYSYIKELSEEVHIPIVYGGGISEKSDIRLLTSLGVERFIVGQSVFSNPDFTKSLVNLVGSSSVAFSLDILTFDVDENLEILDSRSSEGLKLRLPDLFDRLLDIGLSEIIIRLVDIEGSDGKITVEKYTRLLSLMSFAKFKKHFIYLVGSGVRNLEIAQELNNGLVDGFVVGSMICRAKSSNGILISYPKTNSVLDND